MKKKRKQIRAPTDAQKKRTTSPEDSTKENRERRNQIAVKQADK